MHIIWLTTQFPSSRNDTKGSFIYRTVKSLSNIYDLTVLVLYPIIPPIIPMFKDLKNALKIFRDWQNKYPLKPEPPLGLKATVHYVKYWRLPRGIFHQVEGRCAFFAIKKYLRNSFKDKSIIHATWLFPEGELANIIYKNYKIPFLVTLMGSDVNLLKENSEKWYSAQKIIQNSSFITSVSTALYKTLEDKKVLVPENKKQITHTIYEFDNFIIKNKIELKKRLEFNNDQKLIFYAGSLRKLKNVNILIDAFRNLMTNFPKSLLLIAGEGEEEGRLTKQVKKHELSAYVRFLGGLNGQQMIDYYNISDVFCLPSQSEGTPNVIIESLLCGTPVVASNVGEIPFIIKNADNGFLVEPGSILSLEEKLAEALNQKWDRVHLRMSVSRFSPVLVLEEYKKIYESILN